jgi:hypothetical protein
MLLGDPVAQGAEIENAGPVFQAHWLNEDHPGLALVNLDHPSYIELEPNEEACDPTTAIAGSRPAEVMRLLNSVVSETLELETIQRTKYVVRDAFGRIVSAGQTGPGRSAIPIGGLATGSYVISSPDAGVGVRFLVVGH